MGLDLELASSAASVRAGLDTLIGLLKAIRAVDVISRL